jgi:hypothetical protein
MTGYDRGKKPMLIFFWKKSHQDKKRSEKKVGEGWGWEGVR